mgnify:CR=1 FL=1
MLKHQASPVGPQAAPAPSAKADRAKPLPSIAATSSLSPANASLEPIAIIGMSCRLAGDATDISSLWEFLLKEGDGVVQVPDSRWKHSRFFDPDPARPGKYYPPKGGFLKDDVFAFDPLFFGISPRDAESMDPQQRVLMEQIYRAFEDAGLRLEDLRGSQTGMYTGAFTIDNMTQVFTEANRHLQDTASATSSMMTMLSNRMSYIFDLRGPSMTIDTACSSSMVAAHLACQSLRAGETSMAVVGGVNIITRPDNTIALAKGKFVSDHGRCLAFDESASGYSRGEGAAVVVLKRLSDALRDQDKIWGVIRHTGVNQDGKTNGISEPSYEAQCQLVEQVYTEAGVSPASVRYIEAHGTGTQAGDVTESSALRDVFGAARKLADQPAACYVGSIKSNIGHAEAAAGVAGLIKAALVVHHGYIPRTLHVKKLNPKIDLGKWLRIASSGQPYPSEYAIRRASVNSFGYGGTNGHALLEQPPALSGLIKVNGGKASFVRSPLDRLPYMLPISARTPAALSTVAKSLAGIIGAQATASCLDDMLHTLSFRRSHFELRGAVIAKTAEEARTRLLQLSENTPAEGVVLPKPEAATGKRLPLVFVFTGMGPQWHAMGHTLYQESSVFRSALDMLDQAFIKITGQSHLPNMFKDKESSQMHRTSVAQLSNFFLQAGLLAMWHSFGIIPDAVVGHSVGEVASAFASGALSMEDSVLVSHHRGRLQQQLAGRGSMLAAGVSEQAARELLKQHGGKDQVAIAAINAPDSVTLSGELKSLQAIHAQLEAQGTFARWLTVETAYHSAAMDPIRADIFKSLESVRPGVAKIPLYSTVDGKRCDGSKLDAAYWWANVRQEVRFCEAITTIWKDLGPCHFVEVGPHPVLKVSIQRTLADLQPNAKASGADILTTLNRNTAEPLTFMSTLGALYGLGFSPRWQQQLKGDEKMIPLPPYPFERVSYRRLSPLARQELYGQDNASHVYFDTLVESAPGYQQFSVEVGPCYFPWVIDHKVGDSVVFPGAGYVEAGLALARLHQASERLHPETPSTQCFALSRLQFHGMLVYAPAELRRMHLVFDNRQGTRQFQIYSKAAGDVGGSLHHASGSVSLLPFPRADDGNNRFSISDLANAAKYRSCSARVLYNVLSAAGFEYGPAFRTIVSCWMPQSPEVREVVVLLEYQNAETIRSAAAPMSADGPWNPYILHPTMLDGCIQSLVALVDQSAPDNVATCYVPVQINALFVRGQLPSRMFARVQLTKFSKKSIEGSVQMMAEDGTVHVVLKGLVCKALDVGAASAKQSQVLPLLHRLVYDPAAELDPASASMVTKLEDQNRVPIVLVGDKMAKRLASRFSQPRSGVQLLHSIKIQDLSASVAVLQALPRDVRFIFFEFVENLEELDEFSNPNLVESITRRVMAFKSFAQAVRHLAENGAVHVTIPTIGAHLPAGSAPDAAFTAASSSLHLLSAVLTNEEPSYRFQMLDFASKLEMLQWLPTLLSGPHSEAHDAVIRNDQIFVPRCAPWQPESAQDSSVSQEKIRLVNELQVSLQGYNAGSIDRLKFSYEPAGNRALEPHQLEVRLSHTSVNFKDLLKVYGTIADSVIDNTHFGATLGMDVVGKVWRVGSDVQDFHVGDEVVALMGDSFQSHVVTNAVCTFKRPLQVSKESAASLLVYLTAYVGLHQLAQLKAGETVLIHNATGGVGFAAIAVAKWLGAEVLTSAGSDHKRQALAALGLAKVYDSRSLDFVHAIRQDTRNRGVDVVLNATSGDSLIQSVGLLAEGGRFIEIGKKDISQGGTLPLQFFNDNLTFASLDIDRLLKDEPQRMRRDCLTVLELLASGQLNQVQMPFKVFDATHIKDAFALMKSGEHIGKIVVRFEDGTTVQATKQPHIPPKFSRTGSYLVTGGTKNFGLEVAKWIAAHGAGELILASRSGADTPESKQAVQLLKEQGVRVTVCACDVADEDALRDVLLPFVRHENDDSDTIVSSVPHFPLKGVFHAAVVLEDSFLQDLDATSLQRVLTAKVMGVVLLHRLTEQLKIKLDMFVCFSSVSALVANPGQSSYVVANCFLDGLMQRRQRNGLCGVSVNFGSIGGTGILARKEQVRQTFERVGVKPMSISTACDGMGIAIASGLPQLGLFDADFSALQDHLPWLAQSARFTQMIKAAAESKKDGTKTNSQSARQLMLTLSLEDQLIYAQEQVTKAVCEVLRPPASAVHIGRSPQALGVDSLTAVEIGGHILAQTGLRLSTLEILRARSLLTLAERLQSSVNSV